MILIKDYKFETINNFKLLIYYKKKFKKNKKMRPPGLEPGPPTWKVRIIPLDYGRLLY